MLYLIEDRDYLKIGYTNNLVDREKAYKLYNCYAKLLSIKDGVIENERDLHNLCKPWHYQGEWFYNTPEVKQIFEKYDSFANHKLVWLKEIVTNRYMSILKHESLPYLSNKDFLRIKGIKKEIHTGGIPKNIIKWIKCFDEQEILVKILDYLKWGNGKFPEIKFIFEIFPETIYNINSDIDKSLEDIQNTFRQYREWEQEYKNLKSRDFYSLSLQENNRYYNLQFLMADVDFDKISNRLDYIKKLWDRFKPNK